jgi:hypothetical protein
MINNKQVMKNNIHSLIVCVFIAHVLFMWIFPIFSNR